MGAAADGGQGVGCPDDNVAVLAGFQRTHSVGNADDVQNVTMTVDQSAEPAIEQNNEEQTAAEQPVVDVADFTEEDAELDAEQAGLSLDEETAEEQKPKRKCVRKSVKK